MLNEYEKYAKQILQKQPEYETLDEALEKAKAQDKKGIDCDIYQAPKEAGGKYVVIEPDVFEQAARIGYKKVVDYLDIHRTDIIEET